MSEIRKGSAPKKHVVATISDLSLVALGILHGEIADGIVEGLALSSTQLLDGGLNRGRTSR
jgi:hypothetical protein